ncbi:Manganese transporter smf1 [Malassezia cuniculi]|uniref:Manganese transporter smf1 n=1 Tax=Malassezia cuniculi TaxID=948313 RepID=A0AAF0EVZ8_9BASI|nr:Manganese transporter smf1 [Malassezia cuniculi]
MSSAAAAAAAPGSAQEESSCLAMPSQKKQTWLDGVSDTLVRHLSFIGPGLIAAVAYCDPGNWATDMEAGSRFGYSLLFTVLLSGLFAVLLQILCCRLGAVTGMDLSFQTRRLVLGLPPGPGPMPDMRSTRMRLRYWGILIPLYLINEGAIIATELAELIGSAIALNLLFPKLPLWAGVLLTSADVFLVLIMYHPTTGVRLFESFIGILVLVVLACFAVLIGRVQPDWGDVFYGYVPSSTVVESGGLYVSISILGATIMPHSLVLGSHFATIDRLGEYRDLDSKPAAPSERRGGTWRNFWHKVGRQLMARSACVPTTMESDSLEEREPTSLRNLQLHLKHASWDIAICLVLFAITINSAILIVASAAFYYGNNSEGDTEVVADLFRAYELLHDTVGKVPAILFAVALLAAGQSASITVTLAGQIISEGFIHWRVSPLLRRILTRSISMVPSMLVATLVGRRGLDDMLVASQVALSMALPFVSFPLLLLTSMPSRMSAIVNNDLREADTKPTSYGAVPDAAAEQAGTTSAAGDTSASGASGAPGASASAPAPASASTSTLTSTPATATPAASSAALADPEDAASAQAADTAAATSVTSRLARISRFLFTDTFHRNRADAKRVGETYSRSFHNTPLIQVLAWAIFILICVADVYVLINTLRDPSNA